MKTKLITETKEVTRTVYVAEDGTEFLSKEECEKYDASAICAIKAQLNKLNKMDVSVYDIFGEGSEEDEIEIFDIQTENDLINLRRYVYLELSENGCKPKDDEVVIPNATYGHEVILFWWYGHEGCYTIRDGSVDGMCEMIRDNYKDCLLTKEELKAKREAERLARENAQ